MRPGHRQSHVLRLSDREFSIGSYEGSGVACQATFSRAELRLVVVEKRSVNEHKVIYAVVYRILDYEIE